ncbi:MAG: hypothetical protein KY464_00195 [Gemmatimonadetes bacterium]|nr:hypothetical protein [Gemmatimonadota bacterium]
MNDSERTWDFAAEERERGSFILLQHVYSLACEGQGVVAVGKLASDLGLPVGSAVQVVAHLTYADFLTWDGTGRPVGITEKGVEYIERLGHRRRALQLPVPEAAPEPEPVFNQQTESHSTG